jgi:Di-haem oxidoreductase, putative peroxidase
MARQQILQFETPQLTGCPSDGIIAGSEMNPIRMAVGAARTVAVCNSARIEEAILWHDSETRAARERYVHSSAAQRRTLTEWIESL